MSEYDVDPWDSVKRPDHYMLFDGKYEVINLIEDRLKALQHSKHRPDNPIIYSNYANLIKYTMRWFQKGGTQDLEKAKEYLEYILGEYDNVGK